MAAPTKLEVWRKHFNAMMTGKLPAGKKVTLLDSKLQSGSGQIALISPAQDTVNRAKALVEKTSNKRKLSKVSSHSPSKRRTVQIKRKVVKKRRR